MSTQPDSSVQASNNLSSTSAVPEPTKDGTKPAAWWTQAGSTAPPRARDTISLLRIGVALLVAVALLVTWGGGTDSNGWSVDVMDASRLADLNETSAQGAPQQTVVNGWHQVDLAEIQIDQLGEQLEVQGRAVTMLLILGLGYCADLVLRVVAQNRAVGAGRKQGLLPLKST